MKKALALAIFAAASTFGPASSAVAEDQIYVPIIAKGFLHQFWQAVKKGAEQAAKDLNVRMTFEGTESDTMVDKQVDMLAAAIAKKPKVIGFAALDTQAATPLLKKAQAAGIPIIAFDSGVDNDIPATTAATDNIAAAAVAADKMAELIGDKGDVAIVTHSQTSRTGIDRVEGFVNQMKAKHPSVKIVSVQNGDGDQLKSTEITKAILQANPNLKGIFGTAEGSVVGVARGATESKRKLVIVGYDSGKQQKDAIREGVIAGSITQNPVGMGYKTVEAAVKASKGEKLPKKIDTGFFWYDKTNIDDPKIAAVLYD